MENASSGLTVCAERVAVSKAVSEGERQFLALALFADRGKEIVPCGACRQFLSEFSRGLQIWSSTRKGKMLQTSLEALFPSPFNMV